ncbi:DUF3658 domain-containing protein [Lysobacter sp. CA199]|uniref:DUF3658 domain-containing protein n=1 Tax=Lysobacter sp. CA199 TaxID=3455608 RepID=UPI003F8D5FEF
MTTSEYEPRDPPLDEDALKLVAALRPEQIQAIDAALMHVSDHSWHKVAFVVGTTMGNFTGRPAGIPDVFYAQRIIALVTQGRLEAQGDLSRMRYSEVRLAQQVDEA